jgi:hypothetical protein
MPTHNNPTTDSQWLFTPPGQPVPPPYEKSIAYDRENRDYAMRLDGELVGFARTYHEAEITLDQLVFELMSGQYFARQPTAENAANVGIQVAPPGEPVPPPEPERTCPELVALAVAGAG